LTVFGVGQLDVRGSGHFSPGMPCLASGDASPWSWRVVAAQVRVRCLANRAWRLARWVGRKAARVRLGGRAGRAYVGWLAPVLAARVCQAGLRVTCHLVRGTTHALRWGRRALKAGMPFSCNGRGYGLTGALSEPPLGVAGPANRSGPTLWWTAT
jgi:hypothetical protein